MQEKENKTANIKSKFNRNCAVPLCKNWGQTGAVDQVVSYHVFPKDPELRRMWLIKIKREENKQFKASTDYIIKAKSCLNKT
jgi:hypothetical protein